MQHSMWRGKRAYVLVALVFVLGAFWIWINRVDSVNANAEQIIAPHTNFRAPEFSLPALNNETFSLESVRGNVVVLNFWATWCPPCRGEMPALDAVYRAQRERGVIVLGVNQMERADTVQNFAQEFQLAFPILRDADGSLSARYQVSAMPTTFFIDRNGVIRNVVIGGSMSREFIENQVNALLQEKSE